jgi:chemotaxis protein CheD
MELLINSLMKLGADRRRLVAQVFGGGSVIGGLTTAIGARNVAFAQEFLRDESIRVVAQKVGTGSALSVLFDTDTGVARVKELAAEPEVARAERRCMQDLERARPVDQDITFFGAP